MNENLCQTPVILHREAIILRPTNTSRSVCVQDHHILGICPDSSLCKKSFILLELKTINSSLPHMSVRKSSSRAQWVQGWSGDHMLEISGISKGSDWRGALQEQQKVVGCQENASLKALNRQITFSSISAVYIVTRLCKQANTHFKQCSHFLYTGLAWNCTFCFLHQQKQKKGALIYFLQQIAYLSGINRIRWKCLQGGKIRVLPLQCFLCSWAVMNTSHDFWSYQGT